MEGTRRLHAGITTTWQFEVGMEGAHQFQAGMEGSQRLQASKFDAIPGVQTRLVPGYRRLKELGGFRLRSTYSATPGDQT